MAFICPKCKFYSFNNLRSYSNHTNKCSFTTLNKKRHYDSNSKSIGNNNKKITLESTTTFEYNSVIFQEEDDTRSDINMNDNDEFFDQEQYNPNGDSGHDHLDDISSLSPGTPYLSSPNFSMKSTASTGLASVVKLGRVKDINGLFMEYLMLMMSWIYLPMPN